MTALLPAAESESPPTADPPPPAPAPRPPPNRLLVFDAPAPAAAAVEPAREPSPQELLPAAPQQLRLRRRRHPALPPQHRWRERSRRHSCLLTTTPTILHRRRIRRRFIALSIGWPSMRRTKQQSCTTRVNDRRQRCASPEVAAAADRYPTPPGAPDDDSLSSYTDSFKLC